MTQNYLIRDLHFLINNPDSLLKDPDSAIIMHTNQARICINFGLITVIGGKQSRHLHAFTTIYRHLRIESRLCLLPAQMTSFRIQEDSINVN